MSKRSAKTESIIIWTSIFLGISAIILAMIAIVSSSKSSNGNTLIKPINGSDWIRGDINAPIKIVEYSDFQCPACGYYYGITKQIEKNYSDKVVIVYRHFPLVQLHKYAKLAAQASEAAGIQGKFWQMHDFLFNKQQEWSTSPDAMINFNAYAHMLGLDANKFDKDINSKQVISKIDNAILAGNDQKISATPTFFVNGKIVSNIRNYDDFKQIIDKEITNKK